MTYRLKSHLWNGVTELHEDKPYATIGELCDATVALLQDFPAIAVPRLTLTMVIPTGQEYPLGPDALRRCWRKVNETHYAPSRQMAVIDELQALVEERSPCASS